MVTRPEPRGRVAYRHFNTISLRWADNDAYGHVNNTIYYGWFDSTVNGWLVGQGLLDVAYGDPIGLVVATDCRYFSPLSFPGDVEVGMAVERVGNASVTYRLGVFARGADQPAAEGHFTHVCVARETRRPIALPPEWRAAIARLG